MSDTYELIAPCHFGLESVLKKEIYDIGYEPSRVEDGKVTFVGDAEAIARGNINLRTTERLLVKAGEFTALTWDELYEKTRAIEWERFIPQDGHFWVTKANSIKSKLFSPSDIQSIMKKAIVDRLRSVYHVQWFEESGSSYPLRVTINKDVVTVGIDTSGESLHKRGYRTMTAKAPISETLAAALIMLTPWHADRVLVDPFCGSGTFPIEAAMMAANIAPGMNREFLAQTWDNLTDKSVWYDAFDEARDMVDMSVDTDIQGYDIDGEVVAAARINARQAGVESLLHLQQRDVAKLSHPKKYGFIICNPPYGERLSDRQELPELYSTLGRRYAALDAWSMYVITSYEDAEQYIGRRADKNRKIYNGMIKTYFYQFMGPKPPRRSEV